jgi:hypothetical protein
MIQDEMIDGELVASSLALSDAVRLAETALTRALEFSAQKIGVDCHRAVVDRIRKGDKAACGYCHYGLAKEIAERLGELAQDVKVVYLCDYDATPQDSCFCEGTGAALLHLIVWAERRTAALNSLVEVLDRALVTKYADLIDQPHLAHLLDVQVVDDADVEKRVGYGAMLYSLHNRPIEVWKR